ncbi:hypothetical protein [Chitinophaga caseinilytica]|uniref:DKNYY family protein n=1 Tax=Chitinophaga caseinilytica TaxID=2267521 RepID=A0ABZ2ZBS8_9BACT
MNKAFYQTTAYFQTSSDYFWRWAEQYTVIETCFGNTIVYREELATFVENLQDELPPLDALLLVLMACKAQHSDADRKLKDKIAELLDDKLEEEVPHLAERLLGNIRQLPQEWRTGKGRMKLLELLSEDNSCTVYVENVAPMLDFLRKGGIPAEVSDNGGMWHQLHDSITFLAEASRAYPDMESLLRKLGSPGTAIPKPLPTTFPDVLAELEADEQLAGIAKLAKLLKAVMRFPALPENGADDQFGGVSDIGNRGDLHRLLTSELAQDDDLLLARLANNEALFLRKENVPSPPKSNKRVAIDVTLRMWGTNRQFAVAAALAWLQHEADADAWMLSGKEAIDADLQTGTGVLAAMQHLAGEMHCGDALASADKQLRDVECLYISSEENFLSHDFQFAYAGMQHPPALLALIGKNGRINVYSNFRRHRKLLSTATYDLQDILSFKETAPQGNLSLPKIFQNKEWPLLFPWLNRGGEGDKDYLTSDGHVIRVMRDQRLVCGTQRTPARELHANFPEGECVPAYDSQSKRFAMLVLSARNEVMHFVFGLEDFTLIDYHKLKREDNVSVDSWNGRYYFTAKEKTFSINAFNTTERKMAGMPAKYGNELKRDVFVHRKYVRTKYQVYVKPSQICCMNTGALMVDNTQLVRVYEHMKLKSRNVLQERGWIANGAIRNEEKIYPGGNRKVYLRQFRWRNGSLAWSDSRGFLHFRSIDGSIPEITIVAAASCLIAAWTSDNCVCGNDAFIGKRSTATKISVEKFWTEYWEPFIKSVNS